MVERLVTLSQELMKQIIENDGNQMPHCLERDVQIWRLGKLKITLGYWFGNGNIR